MEQIRILEFGSYLAAPLTGKHLVDAGFHVTAVVKPLTSSKATTEQKYMRHMLHDLRRGKQLVTIDLKADLQEARRLICESDVILENLSRGSMERLGIGFEECKRLNPNIIYVSLPGYNTEDAEYASVIPWDSIIMASAGVFRDMGLNRSLLGVPSSFSPLPMPSVYASIFSAFAVVEAVFDRRRGERIEIPLASSLMEALVHNSIEFPLARAYKSLRAIQLEERRCPIGADELDALMDPFFAQYACSDGRPIYVVCPSHALHQERLLTGLGVLDEVSALLPSTAPPYADDRPPSHGIGGPRMTREQAALVRPIMQQAFIKRTADQWEGLLGSRKVPCIALRSTTEWVASEHAIASGLFSRNRMGPLQWQRFERRETVPLHKTLRDLKVLDMTNVIAGPTIGAMLARVGADVTKIDPVRPCYGPAITVVYGVVVNVGKASLLLDVTTPSGRRGLDKLIRESDILLVNTTDDSLVRLGLDPGRLGTLNPNLTLVRFDAWGGVHEAGPFKDYIGYDDNVQAGIGIMERFGGGLDTAEEHAHVGTIDVIAGVAGAFAALVSLLERRLTGRVTTARTSLAAVGQYLQYPFMFDLFDRRPFPSIGRGISHRGFHCLHRLYDTKDGCVIVVGTISNDAVVVRQRYCDLFGDDSVATLLGSRSTAEATKLLQGTGIAVSALPTLAELKLKYTGPVRRSDRTFQFAEYPDHPIGRLVMVRPLMFRETHRTQEPCVAPKYGADTRRILASHNLMHLLADGGAAEAYGRNYIPFPEASCVDADHEACGI